MNWYGVARRHLPFQPLIQWNWHRFFTDRKSFRLSDLSESLGLSHENPHQADSDAQVTAELLLLIQEKMKSLPLVTMEKLRN